MAFALAEQGAVGDDAIAVKLTNKDFFQSTAWLRLRWRLLADGVPLHFPGSSAAADDAAGDGWADLQHDAVPPQVLQRYICSRRQSNHFRCNLATHA